MFLTFVLWGTFGQLDIVVSAHGKLVPTTFVQVSQPVEAGSVVALLVRDGQAVKAGELLARLDSTASRADSGSLVAELSLLKARLAALTTELGQGAPSGLSGQTVVDTEFALRHSAMQHATLATKAALGKAEAEGAATQQSLTKQRRLFELAARAEAAHEDLKNQGFVSELAFQDRLKERIEREQDVKALESTALANHAAVYQARIAVTQVTAEYQKQLAQERTQVVSQLQRAEAELAKADHRTALTEVRAPVDGVVNSLSVRVIGQVVAAGSTLMTIVPAKEALLAEVWVRNEDAGFVAPGTPAKVKLTAFPFQKYGWVDSEVTWVGADSEVPEAMRNGQGEPLFYKARVKLLAQGLTRDGKFFAAKPGMQVQVDVLLGQRSLLEYLISPLKRVALEAARER